MTTTSIDLGRDLHVLLDVDDVPLVEHLRWFAWRTPASRTWYARANLLGGRQAGSILMHRLLIPEAIEVDHRNGDGLDNRRGNLRPATHQQNSTNQRPQQGRASRFKGVSRNTARGPRPWRAYIKRDGRQIGLGTHHTEEAAARAYDAAAVELFGDFAATNESFGLFTPKETS